ncbi:MAG TPA: pantoate--beta-alanine ligase [Polyangiaceae bacterium]|nr:pantoate--beta-alanine ligase [Polyangiaceae bacterium]
MGMGEPRASIEETTSPEALRDACERARRAGAGVAFVPTMGALHEGHLALVRAGRARVGPGGLVVASIFVNPTQFGPTEDLARYPRDLAGDAAKLEAAGCDLLFAPSASAMYTEGDSTRVRVDGLTAHLCGPFRPGHFEGVATVVTKLFALVGACAAIFGKKDYQQLAVLRRVARDLFLPVEVLGHGIVREPSGLAMSSRNAYLSDAERLRALALSRGLRAAAAAFTAGERDAAALAGLVRAEVEPAADSVDYVSAADPDTLAPLEGLVGARARALLAIACRVGATRLLDNFVLGEDTPGDLEPASASRGERRAS